MNFLCRMRRNKSLKTIRKGKRKNIEEKFLTIFAFNELRQFMKLPPNKFARQKPEREWKCEKKKGKWKSRICTGREIPYICVFALSSNGKLVASMRNMIRKRRKENLSQIGFVTKKPPKKDGDEKLNGSPEIGAP